MDLDPSRGAAVHVLHVAERDVVAGIDVADLETPEEATALLEASVAALSEAGVPVAGEVLRVVGSHADVADAILRRAGRLGAGLIVIGPDSGQTRLHPTMTGEIAARAPSHVIVLNPRAGALGRPASGRRDRRRGGALARRAHLNRITDGRRCARSRDTRPRSASGDACSGTPLLVGPCPAT